MKRTGILALLLVFLVAFGVACAPATEPAATATPAAESAATTTPAVEPDTAADPAVGSDTTDPATVSEETQGGAYTPGVYTASAKGKNGDIKVEVEVSETEILSVKVLEHQETEGISDKAISDLPAAIVAAQGLGLDAVSSATVTSNAILEAVADCMEQAGADVEALKTISVAEAE